MELIFEVLASVVFVYQLIVLAAVLMSWVQPSPDNPIVQFILTMTEPIFDGLRRNFPFLTQAGLDLSPIVVLFGLHMVHNLLMSLAHPY